MPTLRYLCPKTPTTTLLMVSYNLLVVLCSSSSHEVVVAVEAGEASDFLVEEPELYQPHNLENKNSLIPNKLVIVFTVETRITHCFSAQSSRNWT